MPIGIYKRKPFAKEHLANISKAKMGHLGWWKGKKRPAASTLKMIGQNRDEENCNWKGDRAGYGSIHFWVVRRKGKPLKCEVCWNDELKSRQYHWANIDHKYNRVLEDFLRMCATCHKFYDRTFLQGKYVSYMKKKGTHRNYSSKHY